MSLRVENILKAHGLRLTAARKDILSVFVQKGQALAHVDLEQELTELDRVTIYRSLQSFLEKGIVHKVLDDEHGAKYALCHDNCSEKAHQDAHVHFKCTNCNKLICLPDYHIPSFQLPDGYQTEAINLLVNGRCADCSVKTSNK